MFHSKMIFIRHLLAEGPEKLVGPLLADRYVTLLKGCNAWCGQKLAKGEINLDMGDNIKREGNDTNFMRNELSGYVGVTSSSEQGTRGCGKTGGTIKSPRLMFRIFDMEMYTIDPLISQLAELMSFCPKYSYPQPHPYPVSPATPPSKLQAPPLPPFPPTPSWPHLLPMDPFPYLETSACSHQSLAQHLTMCLNCMD
ncbi:putative glycerol-3-phosphate dehydrogenase [NAD(+)] 3, cytosolic [Capsicum baccatum]|uniref:Glycerol-3-phosphate dehydrogenase [NAD(+)] 3, cytosolic n=1 Tax=Capsicum baccatum TaxID=33114 RepID=A0A2G2WCR9_CAPBA|nr:putative glycerol-3-phosphate dehydrogenase [NAD(+)] 3, cytosolic [Capsicum baccatum]